MRCKFRQTLYGAVLAAIMNLHVLHAAGAVVVFVARDFVNTTDLAGYKEKSSSISNVCP